MLLHDLSEIRCVNEQSFKPFKLQRESRKVSVFHILTREASLIALMYFEVCGRRAQPSSDFISVRCKTDAALGAFEVDPASKAFLSLLF